MATMAAQPTQKNKTILRAEPGSQEIFMTREFDAPRELVFRAHTEPELYARWLGPDRLVTHMETFEPVSGGRWRFVQREADGSEYGFHGNFHEVNAPERIISTFEFEGLPEAGHVSLETTVFEALPGGRTRLHVHAVYLTVADRDGLIQSGMEEGVLQGYARLDTLLAELKR